MQRSLEVAVAAHYGIADLVSAIDDGLAAAGADRAAPTVEDLAPVDEFHLAGRLTTLKAFAMTPLAAGMHVLDAGCGIGGTARCLMAEHGCRVTGIDLTPEFVETARVLTRRMGFDHMGEFHAGSVTAMPFATGRFDAAVTFHVAMNIADRAAFYGEVARVLKPGAPFCVCDIMKGPTDGMIYPVPWAETEETSFLKSVDETCALLADAGFAIGRTESLRDFGIGYFREVFAAIAANGGPPPLGLHLLTGANTAEKFANVAQALEDHRIDPFIVVATRL